MNALRGAASEFKKFLENYPTHPKIPDAFFNLGSLYGDLSAGGSDRDAATRSMHYFKELLHGFPKDRLADDALFQIAALCRNVFHDEKCAQDAEQRILSEYANGDIAPKLVRKSVGPAQLNLTSLERNGGDLVFTFQLTAPRPLQRKTLPADEKQNLPERFYVDLENTQLSKNESPSLEPSDPISQVRFGAPQGVLRVVLDLKPGTTGDQVKLVPTSQGFEIRVASAMTNAALTTIAVLEEAPKKTVVPVVEATASPVAVVEVPQIPPVIPVPEAKNSPKGKYRIVLDAGHGGEDSGARGKRGSEEKTVCLSIVKRVEELLSKRAEYDLFLTRKDDHYVALAERTRLANAWGGQLFVSIHANASPRRGAEGVSTYFLDNHDDEESLRVAMRENAEPGVATPQGTGLSENQYLEIMKASMAKNFHTVQSTEFAQGVQTNLVKELRTSFSGVTDLGVKSARFFVLTGAQMPAILVETSFISNPQEERRLADSHYQKLIAKSVVRGIDQFFKSSVGRGDHAALFQN